MKEQFPYTIDDTVTRLGELTNFSQPPRLERGEENRMDVVEAKVFAGNSTPEKEKPIDLPSQIVTIEQLENLEKMFQKLQGISEKDYLKGDKEALEKLEKEIKAIEQLSYLIEKTTQFDKKKKSKFTTILAFLKKFFIRVFLNNDGKLEQLKDQAEKTKKEILRNEAFTTSKKSEQDVIAIPKKGQEGVKIQMPQDPSLKKDREPEDEENGLEKFDITPGESSADPDVFQRLMQEAPQRQRGNRNKERPSKNPYEYSNDFHEAYEELRERTHRDDFTINEVREHMRNKEREGPYSYGRITIQNADDFASEIIQWQGNRQKWEHDYSMLNGDGTINRANFLRWIRDRIQLLVNERPDELIDFSQNVALWREGNAISLTQMIRQRDLYFKSIVPIQRKLNEQGEVDEKNGELQYVRIKRDPQGRPLDSSERIINIFSDKNKIVYEKVPLVGEGENKRPDFTQIEFEEKILDDLADATIRESWLPGASRNKNIDYTQVMGSDNELPKKIVQLYLNNEFSKTVWDGKSALYWLMTLPGDLDPNNPDDVKVGAAMTWLYMCYSRISDFDTLQDYLGEKAPLFRKDRFMKMRSDIAKEGFKLNDNSTEQQIDDAREQVVKQSLVDKIFDEEGNIKDKEAFIDFINIYNHPQKDAAHILLTRRLLKESLVKQLEFYVPKKDEFTGHQILEDTQGNLVESMFDKQGNKIPGVKPRYVRNIEYEIETDANGNPLKDKFGDPQYRKDKSGEKIPKLVNGQPVYAVDEEDGGPSYKIDWDNLDYSDFVAYTMPRWTMTAGYNDVTARAHDAATKFELLDVYRSKLWSERRGGAAGIPYTRSMIKGTGTDFMTGTRVEVRDYDAIKEDDTGEDRFERPWDILEKARTAGKDMTEFRKQMGGLVFPENTMRYYSFDHINRAFEVFQQIINAEELKLEKFTHYDPFKGVTFDRAQFGETISEKLIKPMRYMFQTYGQLDFSKKVRRQVNIWNPDKKDPETGKKGTYVREYLDIPLALSFFGFELLDNKEFWKKDYERDELSRRRFYDRDTRQLVALESRDDRGELIYLDPTNINHQIEKKSSWIANITGYHEHDIDYDYLNTEQGKMRLWKRLAMGRIAAELYAHRDLHSTDPRYDFRYYETVIRALEQIPAHYFGDEFDLQTNKVTGGFFTEEDIEWIREKSDTKSGKLFIAALLGAILSGGFKGSRSAMSLFLRAAFFVEVEK